MKTLISNERTDPHDPEYKERRKKSLKFIGTLQELKARVTITDFDGFTDQIDSFTAKVPRTALLPDNTYKIVYMTSLFTETQEESQLFRVTITYGGTPGTSKETWKVANVANGTGSGKGSYIPSTVRLKGLPEPKDYVFEFKDTDFELQEKENDWNYIESNDKDLSIFYIIDKPGTGSHARFMGEAETKGGDDVLQVCQNIDDKHSKKNHDKKNLPVEVKNKETGNKSVKKKAGTPKVELRSNTDNHVLFTDKFGTKWPSKSSFDESPLERKYQIEGKPLLIAVNDDYTEEQTLKSWVKDNIAGSNGHKIVAGDKSLQDGKLIFPVDLKGDKITLAFSSKIKVWWKIPNTSNWTEIPKEDTTEFKKFTDGEIPLKIEGISPGTGTIQFSFSFGKEIIKDQIQFKVMPTYRMIVCFGKPAPRPKDPVKKIRAYFKTLKNDIIDKVAPSGVFELRGQKAYVQIVKKCAKKYYPEKGKEYPDYWDAFSLVSHGHKPTYTQISPFREKRLTTIPGNVLADSDDEKLYKSYIKQLRGLGWLIQGGRATYNKEARKVRTKLNRLKLKPKYIKDNFGLASYLEFYDGDYWVKELFYPQKFNIFELSCWNWWAGGIKNGKIVKSRKGINYMCVDISSDDKTPHVFEGKQAIGSPFPLNGNFIARPAVKHVRELFNKQISNK